MNKKRLFIYQLLLINITHAATTYITPYIQKELLQTQPCNFLQATQHSYLPTKQVAQVLNANPTAYSFTHLEELEQAVLLQDQKTSTAFIVNQHHKQIQLLKAQIDQFRELLPISHSKKRHTDTYTHEKLDAIICNAYSILGQFQNGLDTIDSMLTNMPAGYSEEKKELFSTIITLAHPLLASHRISSSIKSIIKDIADIHKSYMSAPFTYFYGNEIIIYVADQYALIQEIIENINNTIKRIKIKRHEKWIQPNQSIIRLHHDMGFEPFDTYHWFKAKDLTLQKTDTIDFKTQGKPSLCAYYELKERLRQTWQMIHAFSPLSTSLQTEYTAIIKRIRGSKTLEHLNLQKKNDTEIYQIINTLLSDYSLEINDNVLHLITLLIDKKFYYPNENKFFTAYYDDMKSPIDELWEQAENIAPLACQIQQYHPQETIQESLRALLLSSIITRTAAFLFLNHRPLYLEYISKLCIYNTLDALYLDFFKVHALLEKKDIEQELTFFFSWKNKIKETMKQIQIIYTNNPTLFNTLIAIPTNWHAPAAHAETKTDAPDQLATTPNDTRDIDLPIVENKIDEKTEEDNQTTRLLRMYEKYKSQIRSCIQIIDRIPKYIGTLTPEICSHILTCSLKKDTHLPVQQQCRKMLIKYLPKKYDFERNTETNTVALGQLADIHKMLMAVKNSLEEQEKEDLI